LYRIQLKDNYETVDVENVANRINWEGFRVKYSSRTEILFLIHNSNLHTILSPIN
jgi:hypothetical protein